MCVSVQGQFINDREVLLNAAKESGVTGAQELMDNEEQLKSEVTQLRTMKLWSGLLYNASVCEPVVHAIVCYSLDLCVK